MPIAEPDADGPARFLAADDRHRLALVLECLLDDLGEALRAAAEEFLGGFQHLVLTVGLGRLRLLTLWSFRGRHEREREKKGHQPSGERIHRSISFPLNRWRALYAPRRDAATVAYRRRSSQILSSSQRTSS